MVSASVQQALFRICTDRAADGFCWHLCSSCAGYKQPHTGDRRAHGPGSGCAQHCPVGDEARSVADRCWTCAGCGGGMACFAPYGEPSAERFLIGSGSVHHRRNAAGYCRPVCLLDSGAQSCSTGSSEGYSLRVMAKRERSLSLVTEAEVPFHIVQASATFF